MPLRRLSTGPLRPPAARAPRPGGRPSPRRSLPSARLGRRLAAVVSGLVLVGAWPLDGQESRPPEPGAAVAEALRLRETGAYAEAAARLREHLDERPGDASVLRLLAQTLYWAGEHAQARAAWARALESAPGDGGLRLEYGRALVELLRRGEAREVLAPLVPPEFDGPPAAPPTEQIAEASTLLGTAAYWDGAYGEAVHRFETALELVPGHVEAARLLAEIRVLTAPRVEVEVAARSDNQPVDLLEGRVAGSFFPLPDVEVGALLRPLASLDDGRTFRATELLVRARGYLPGLRTEWEVAGGGLRAREPGAGSATGEVALGLRLPRRLTLRARARRQPYLWTEASLEAPVFVESLGAELDRADAPGWAGALGGRWDRFADGNRVWSAWGWGVVPLVSGRRGSLRTGWAFAREDAERSTFTATTTTTVAVGEGPVPGRYEPYYTPEGVSSHGPVVGAALGSGPLRVEVDGSWGLAAREEAPFLFVAGSPERPVVEKGFAERSYHPWRVRARVTVPAGAGLEVHTTLEHERTAYFRLSRAAVTLSWRRPPPDGVP